MTTHHSSVTTIDHNADGSITTTTTDLDRGEITRIDHTGGPAGTDFHIDNQEHGAPAAPPPVTGEGVHPAGHEYHAAE